MHCTGWRCHSQRRIIRLCLQCRSHNDRAADFERLTAVTAEILEIASPATLLVVLGLIGIHLERAFKVGEGPFTRSRFGMAFFWSGHFQLAVGLVLVLGAQIFGNWLHPFGFRLPYTSLHATPSPICGELRWLGLALVAAGTYAYAWSDLVVRKKGIFLHIAAFMLLWAEILVVQILDLHVSIDAVITILAVTSLLSHVRSLHCRTRTSLLDHCLASGCCWEYCPSDRNFVFVDHFGFRAVWIEQRHAGRSWAMLLTAFASREALINVDQHHCH
ncbi:MAG: hypothetical protein U0936_17245 [Planctomycetaceae bacterium]